MLVPNHLVLQGLIFTFNAVAVRDIYMDCCHLFSTFLSFLNQVVTQHALLEKVSEYDQEIPQSHTADKLTSP